MSRLAVFAYGSLVSPASASQTLGRPIADPQPAALAGWRRCWTLARDNRRSEKSFALADGTLPTHCLALNLEPSADAPSPNGALIEVTGDELERLDARELRYRRVEVTGAAGAAGMDAVYAYVARPEHHHPEPPAGAIVIAEYVRTVEAAFAKLGPGELDRFRATTAPPGAEVAEAELVLDQVPPGNPRAW